MRTTVRIDDELMRRLKELAHREGISLTKLLNRVLRSGMAAPRQALRPARPYRQKTYRMGQPKFPLDKALAFAASLEDEEVLDKLARRK
jgi:hypothetical protein